MQDFVLFWANLICVGLLEEAEEPRSQGWRECPLLRASFSSCCVCSLKSAKEDGAKSASDAPHMGHGKPSTWSLQLRTRVFFSLGHNRVEGGKVTGRADTEVAGHDVTTLKVSKGGEGDTVAMQ